MTITSPQPLSNAEQIKSRIADLQKALQTQSPGYESLLHTIHVATQKDEAIMHLLTEDEVGVLVAGLAKKKNIIIATSAAKSKTTSGKSLKNIDADDLGM